MTSQASSHYIVYTDGGSRGNPGPAGIGYVVYNGEELLYQCGKVISNTTNNVAEYTALINALQYLKKSDAIPQSIQFRLDSELVVRQMMGLYRVKDENLKSLKIIVDDLILDLINSGCQRITFHHVPRAENKLADKLVNDALDGKL